VTVTVVAAVAVSVDTAVSMLVMVDVRTSLRLTVAVVVQSLAQKVSNKPGIFSLQSTTYTMGVTVETTEVAPG
jgi:hypothetical protein